LNSGKNKNLLVAGGDLALPGNGRLEKPGVKKPEKKRAAC